MSTVSSRISAIQGGLARFFDFHAGLYSARAHEPGMADFTFGNPHELPLPAIVQELQRAIVPQRADWFAYKDNQPEARAAVAAALRERLRMPFEPADIFLTSGAFAALAVALAALVDAQDEVIFISPPWFFYEAMIAAQGATPVRVSVDPTTFDLDLGAIAAAITPRTRAIIVNSPNNPTGTIYPPETLRALAELLSAASARNGRPIYLLSDESYSRIIFDGRAFHSPTAFYPHSLLLYTYGKTLLIPGLRAGYIALPPAMPEREQVRAALFTAQLITGWSFPNALLQQALPELEQMSIDIAHLQRKRDRLVSALRSIGYQLHSPAGTFYLLVRAPIADERAFAELLADHQVLCLPGGVFEMPGYFRLSLTASDEMIERALPGLAGAFQKATEAYALSAA